MMEFFNNFHFLRPWFLLLLIFLIVPYLKGKTGEIISDSPWAKVCDKNLLQFLLVKKQVKRKKTIRLLQFLILLILPLSLAGPCWQKTENPVLSINNPVIIALNMSGNMWSKDVSPSRAERAKFLIKDILKGLDAAEVGFEVYSREPFIISPISDDKSLIDNLLPAVTYDIMPENGDRLDRAIDLAVERLKNAHYTDGNIIVLTFDVGERFDLALESAAKAATEGYITNVIDINSSKNSKLEMVAQKGRGMYLHYDENLAQLLKNINNVSAKQFAQSENMQVVWHDNGWYLLFLPALLLLYFFRRGVVFVIFAYFIAIQSATAGWFLNNNQEAMQAFEKGDFAQAMQKFENQPWKAGAAYKNGDFNTSAQIYSALDGTENLYNYGNALAKSGKIKEAIAVYEKVLKQNPNHEDAKFNLEYLKQQQKNQQQNQNKDKQNQQQDQNTAKSNSEQNQFNEQQSSEKQQPKEKNQSEEQQIDEQNSTMHKNQQEEQKSSLQNSKQENDEEADMQVAASKDSAENAQEKQKMRAREQKFRKIKEDKGGLLRAFIRKEYNRQRYRE